MARKITADPALYGPRKDAEPPNTEPPVALPLGYSHPETIEETVARLLRSEQLARLAASQGVETLDEFLDFGDESDDDPSTPHEEFYDPLLRRPTSLLELKQLDATIKSGGSVHYSEEDALAIRRHLRQVAADRLPLPPLEDSGGEAPAALPDDPKPA